VPKTRRLSDANLVRRSQQGDRRAFSALVGRYDWRLRGLAFALLLDRAEMDAALSAAYLRSWRDIVRVSTKDDIAAWLYRNAYNACVDRLRLGRSAARAGGRALQGTGVPTGVVPVLAAMPETERVALVLVDREGFDPQPAARIMGLPAAMVDQCLASARARLAEHLATAVPAPSPAPEPTADPAAGEDERDTGDIAVTVGTPEAGGRQADAADPRSPAGGNGKGAEAPARSGERAAQARDRDGAVGNGERAARAPDGDGAGSGNGGDAVPALAGTGGNGEDPVPASAGSGGNGEHVARATDGDDGGGDNGEAVAAPVVEAAGPGDDVAAPAAAGPGGAEGDRGDEEDEGGGDEPAGDDAVVIGKSDGNGAAGNGHGSRADVPDGTGVDGTGRSGGERTDGSGVDGTDGADDVTAAGYGHGTGEQNRGRGRRARKRAKHAATRTVDGPGEPDGDASGGSEP
jgi:RNA polymerase sigma-70 factor (ECF subfamily)